MKYSLVYISGNSISRTGYGSWPWRFVWSFSNNYPVSYSHTKLNEYSHSLSKNKSISINIQGKIKCQKVQ